MSVHKHWVLEHQVKQEHAYTGSEAGCYLCDPKKLKPCSTCKASGAEYGFPECADCLKRLRKDRLWKIIVQEG